MLSSDQARVRTMNASDLALVLMWRNDPNVRRYMYTQHEISIEEHTRWFKRASQDSMHHLLVFENENVPLGFINIHEKAAGNIADWGFYNAPGAPKGTGWQLGIAALEYAFITAGLYKLCGQALSYNHKSIRFHNKLGFTQEGTLRHQHFDGVDYHDIVCFGLLSSEWKMNNRG